MRYCCAANQWQQARGRDVRQLPHLQHDVVAEEQQRRARVQRVWPLLQATQCECRLVPVSVRRQAPEARPLNCYCSADSNGIARLCIDYNGYAD